MLRTRGSNIKIRNEIKSFLFTFFLKILKEISNLVRQIKLEKQGIKKFDKI